MSGFQKFALEGFKGRTKKADPKRDGDVAARYKGLLAAASDVLTKPKNERDELLAALRDETRAALDKLGPLQKQAGARLRSTLGLLEVLQRMSDKQG